MHYLGYVMVFINSIYLALTCFVVYLDSTLILLFFLFVFPQFESNEDDKLLHNAQLWLQALRKKFSKREYKVIILDYLFVCLFVCFCHKLTRPQLSSLHLALPCRARYKTTGDESGQEEDV